MPKHLATKPNLKAAWIKELHIGEEGSVWRFGAEAVDEEMQAARKLLDASGLPYTARDLVRLTRALFRAATVSADIWGLAKARLDCERIAYGAGDVIEMVAVLAEGMDRMKEIMDEADDEEDCPECAGQARH